MPKRASFLVSLLLAAAASVPASAAVIERDITVARDRIQLSVSNGVADLRIAGGSREFQPGRPDLPMTAERVVLPAGMRVAKVEVVSLESEPLSGAVRVLPAFRSRPGIVVPDRSEEDPAFYRQSGMQPQVPVTLGYQGSERGVNVALLKVNPVRWDAVSGRLERLSRIKVRLELENDDRTDIVKRERIVREWERELPGTPLRNGGAQIVSMTPTGGRGAQPFKPTQVPSVLGSPVEYVIVTTDAYVSEFQRLADWKTESGTPAVVRTLSFIRQEYPFGADDADRIRQFIRDCYARWGTKWVLLGGDTEIIPTRFAYTTFYNGESIACDMYFSCLDGTWNADGDNLYGESPPTGTNDNCDLMPEVYVGRAPVSNPQQLTTFVNKALQYEKTPAGDYENRVLFFAEVLFPQDWEVVGGTPSLDGAQIVEEDCLQHVHYDPNIKYARLYQNHLDSRWEPGAIEETRQRVIDSLNVGYNVANHTGHGYRNVMSVGDASLTNGDAAGLTNGNRLTNLYAANCTSNAIDFPCIGEAFMHAENGGAVSNVGSSRFDFPVVGRDYQGKFFQLMYVDSMQAVGELQAEQKVPFIAFSAQDYVHRWTQFTLLLLGDPELRIYTGKPRTLAVTHTPTIALGDTTYTVTVQIAGQPLLNARVTLYKSGDEYRSALTNGAGVAVLDFRPDSTGTAKLTVTGYDCRPYQATVTINGSGQAVLVESTPQIDDDALGGSSGNADGKFDAGETIDLRIAVRNTGGATAPGVTGTLSTTDGLVTIVTPATSYGSVAPGAIANGGTYRLSLPYNAPDQREIPLRLDLLDTNGRHSLETLSLTSRSPEPRHFRHVITEISGNFNGRPETGETADYQVVLRNLGTGTAPALTAVLRNYDGKATVTDSTASFAINPSGGEVTGDPFRFTVNTSGALFELRVSSAQGLLMTHTFDLTWPNNLSGLTLVSGANYISLTWTPSNATDLSGYNIYRSLAQAGPYNRINKVPTDRTGYFRDEGLTPLTRYYYRVSAVDSSGNESGLTGISSETTTPPTHGFFPILMGQTTPASVALARIYQPGTMDIVAGADLTYLWHADGSAPVDADGDIVNTQGDFSLEGSYFAAGPSVADLDGGGMEIISPTWTSQGVYVFDTAGNLKPGWPFTITDPIWTGVAIGDLNNDGSKELVFGSNGTRIYALRANGTEWIDGDANAGTIGVFKNLPVANNFSTPALADVNRDGQLDVVYAGFNGVLYAWNANGTNVTGFPFSAGGQSTASPAIGFLDGAPDTTLDIVFLTSGSSHDSLYVVTATGQRRAGFPKLLISGGTSKQPSPALADMDNDGFLDIVVASTNGLVYVFDRNGVQNPLFTNARYGPSTSGASESSPVVADMNGDGFPDVLIGGEDAQLTAFSGQTGTMLPGFPIRLGAEVRGVPGLCDCDGDGMTEIVLACWDQNLYVWDYDFPFNPNGLPAWPQFHHDAMRTGLASGPTLVDAPNPGPVLPTKLALNPPSPNPTRGATMFAWAIPAARAGEAYELSIYDLSGRLVKQLSSGRATAGQFNATWDRRDDSGSRVGGGIYFARFRVGGEALARKLIVMP